MRCFLQAAYLSAAGRTPAARRNAGASSSLKLAATQSGFDQWVPAEERRLAPLGNAAMHIRDISQTTGYYGRRAPERDNINAGRPERRQERAAELQFDSVHVIERRADGRDRTRPALVPHPLITKTEGTATFEMIDARCSSSTKEDDWRFLCDGSEA